MAKISKKKFRRRRSSSNRGTLESNNQSKARGFNQSEGRNGTIRNKRRISIVPSRMHQRLAGNKLSLVRKISGYSPNSDICKDLEIERIPDKFEDFQQLRNFWKFSLPCENIRKSVNAKNKWCGKFTAHSAHLWIIVEKELPISPQITKNNTSNLQYFGNKNNGNLLLGTCFWIESPAPKNFQNRRPRMSSSSSCPSWRSY